MRRLSGLALLIACAGLVGAYTGLQAAETKMAAKKMAPKKPILWSAEELKFVEAPEAPGVSEAVLWGDPKKGAYGAIDRWKAGTEFKLHTHSYDVRGVVLSGTVELTIAGMEPKQLGPGSYVMVPARVKHVSKCNEGEDCQFFVEQPGLFDIHLVETAAAGNE